MPNIDDRVVAMSFENDKFENGVKQSINSINQLKSSLDFTGAGKGLENVQNQAGKFNLNHISDSVDSIKDKFSSLSVIGISALATLTNRAVDSGIELAKAFTIDPIRDGFNDYQAQINAALTIMNTTGLKGSAGLAKVTDVLRGLNEYADLTVYNFSDLAQKVGIFTAAGVSINTAAESIKGLANLAAYSGATVTEATSAMTQLSRAVSGGETPVRAWTSIMREGLGGTAFQGAIANTAVAMEL